MGMGSRFRVVSGRAAGVCRPSAGFAIGSLFPAVAGKVFLAPDLAKGDAAGRCQEMAML